MSATAGDDSLPGSNGSDTIDGLAGNDTITGLINPDLLIGGDGDDNLSGGNGDDTLQGGDDNDSLVGGTGTDLYEGGAGNDTLFGTGTGTNETLDGGAGDDYIYAGDATGTVITGGGTDIVDLANTTPAGSWTLSGNEWTNGTITVDTTGSTVTFTDDGSNFFSNPNAVCFAAGTRILTARGEVPVETLSPGELVATVAGAGAPMKPVVFLGRRRFILAGNPAAEALAPVSIAAGALAENTPHRDLLVSPDHCLLLDGRLVPARLLVNGSTITIERRLPEVTYFHIELEAHDAVLAEGAAAESWLDTGNRAWFENAPVARLAVRDNLAAHGEGFDATRACAPLVQGGPELAAIRDSLALRMPGTREAEAA